MADETTDTATSTETTTATTESAATTETASAAAEGGATSDAGASDDVSIVGSSTADTGAGDTKSEGGKEGESKPTAETDTQPSVPEAYELKPFTVGEGEGASTVEIDASLLETVTPGLKEAGITQEQLEKLAPSVVPAIQEQALKQLNDSYAATVADWAKEAKADPEIGGAKFDESRQLAAKALDHFGAKSEKNDKGEETNPFRKMLNESGLGNHPVMLRMFRNIGASLSESSEFVRNTNETAAKKSREEINYPNDLPKT